MPHNIIIRLSNEFQSEKGKHDTCIMSITVILAEVLQRLADKVITGSEIKSLSTQMTLLLIL